MNKFWSYKQKEEEKERKFLSHKINCPLFPSFSSAEKKILSLYMRRAFAKSCYLLWGPSSPLFLSCKFSSRNVDPASAQKKKKPAEEATLYHSMQTTQLLFLLSLLFCSVDSLCEPFGNWPPSCLFFPSFLFFFHVNRKTGGEKKRDLISSSAFLPFSSQQWGGGG